MKAVITRVVKGKKIGQYRFRLKAANNKTVATSGSETYHNLGDLEDTLNRYFPDFKHEHKF